MIDQSHPGPGFCPYCGALDVTDEHIEECLFADIPPAPRLDTSSPGNPRKIGDLR